MNDPVVGVAKLTNQLAPVVARVQSPSGAFKSKVQSTRIGEESSLVKHVWIGRVEKVLRMSTKPFVCRTQPHPKFPTRMIRQWFQRVAIRLRSKTDLSDLPA